MRLIIDSLTGDDGNDDGDDVSASGDGERRRRPDDATTRLDPLCMTNDWPIISGAFLCVCVRVCNTVRRIVGLECGDAGNRVSS